MHLYIADTVLTDDISLSGKLPTCIKTDTFLLGIAAEHISCLFHAAGKPKTITIHIENEDYKHLAYNIVDKKVIASTKVKKLNKQLNNSYFKKTSELYKDRPDDNIDKFHYLKVRGRRIYFNIARYKYERKGKRKGTFYYKYRLHAITKNCK